MFDFRLEGLMHKDEKYITCRQLDPKFFFNSVLSFCSACILFFFTTGDRLGSVVVVAISDDKVVVLPAAFDIFFSLSLPSKTTAFPVL